jgi:hypothetical protein
MVESLCSVECLLLVCTVNALFIMIREREFLLEGCVIALRWARAKAGGR